MKQLTDEQIEECWQRLWGMRSCSTTERRRRFGIALISEFCRINGITGEAQPAREWVGLTDDERNEIYRKSFKLIDSRLVGEQVDFVRAIESKLREKNAGQPAADDKAGGYEKALEIRTAQGWKLTGEAIPVLYTDSINGQQVCRDDVWLCTTAALRKEDDKAGGEPVKFLCNGTRFKMAFFDDGDDEDYGGTIHVKCFNNFEKELDGRWVALVAAEDDCHLKYTHPQPQAEVRVPDGWQEVSGRTVSSVLQVLADVALMEVETRSKPSGHSVDYMRRDPVVAAIQSIRRAVSELAEFSRNAAAPKPQEAGQ